MWEELREMRSKQEDIATKAKAKLDEIKADTPEERAAEIEREFDTMMADYDAIGAKADRVERLDKAQREMQRGDDRRPTGDAGEQPAQETGDEITYRAAFHEMLSCQGQLGAMSPEARSVLAAGYSSVPKGEQRAQTVSSDAGGGYAVPDEMMQNIVKSMKAWGPMYDDDICTVIVTNGGASIPIPTVDDTDNEAAEHTEGGTLTDDGSADVVFGRKTLEAFAYNTSWIRVSKELADDSATAMETLIGGLLGERCGRIANRRLTTGDGSGMPHGVALAAGDGIDSEVAAEISWDDVINLEHSVDPAYRSGPGVRYMFNDATLLAMRKIKDNEGRYVWVEGSVEKGIRPTFNNRPYSINQAMPGVATSNRPMVFGDFKKYFVRRVGNVLIGAIQDKDFWPGFGIAGYIRFDGLLGDAGAIKALTIS